MAVDPARPRARRRTGLLREDPAAVAERDDHAAGSSRAGHRVGLIAGRTLAASHGAAGAAAQIAAIVLLAGAALSVLMRLGPTTRPLLGAGVGALVTLHATESLPVLLHGFVLSRLPANVDRGATALGLGTGLSLLALLVVTLRRDLAENRESPACAGLSRGALERT